MITRERKAQDITGLSERFSKAKAAFLVDFKGLDVEKMTSLRKSLLPVSAEMRVVKNTLALRAMKEHEGYDGAFKDHMTGNNALVFAFEDVSASAKTLTGFAKENDALVLKAGAMDGKALDEAQIIYLATLPGKDELRAMLLGTLAAPASKFVRLLNEVPSSFVRVLAAKRDKTGN